MSKTKRPDFGYPEPREELLAEPAPAANGPTKDELFAPTEPETPVEPTRTTKPTRRVADPELVALARLQEILDAMPERVRIRCLTWLCERYCDVTLAKAVQP